MAAIAASLGQSIAALGRGTGDVSLRPGQIFHGADAPWRPEMVVIPAGRFVMGSPADEEGRSNNKGPRHEVTFARPFALRRFTVTFGEYDAFCAATGHRRPEDEWGRGRQPVIDVRWDDATAYCRWLAERTGNPYRLPSEAEWEYGCRAGATTPFWTGATISADQANYDGRFTYGTGVRGVLRECTVPVDDPSFPPNPFGLSHMHGNVGAWVEDRSHDSYGGAPRDGSAWAAGDEPHHVLRGGSWDNNPGYPRAAFRSRFAPENRYSGTGVRVARMLTPQIVTSLPRGGAGPEPPTRFVPAGAAN